jgi:SprT protein
MHVSAELKARVEKELARHVSNARFLWGRDFKMPEVRYDVRGTVAGYANLASNTIRLNPVLLNENVDAFIARTVPHEFAHLVDYVLNPGNFSMYRSKRSVHGPSWKRIMRDLGCDPSRCHTYDTTNARKNTKAFIWVCSHCGEKIRLGPKRHEKMASGRARYWSLACRSHKDVAKYVLETTGPVPVRPVMKAAASAATINKPKTAGSKLELCRKLFLIAQEMNQHTNRQEMIARFVSYAGCTPAGAATYFSKLKSEVAGR